MQNLVEQKHVSVKSINPPQFLKIIVKVSRTDIALSNSVGIIFVCYVAVYAFCIM